MLRKFTDLVIALPALAAATVLPQTKAFHRLKCTTHTTELETQRVEPAALSIDTYERHVPFKV